MKRLLPLLMLLPVSCDRPPAPRPERLERIVSIVPGVTELLFQVGAGDQIVGVTTYCDFPPEARRKEKIGDITVNLEKILALRPDAVFSSDSLARQTNLALEGRGLRVVRVDPESFEQIAEELRRLGGLTGHPERGAEEARKLLERIRAVEERGKGKPAPTVYIETSSDPLGTAGPGSYAGDALRRAGGRNIMDDLERPWALVSWEVVLRRDPDVILIAHDHSDGLERRPGWSGLKAVKSGRVHLVPKEAFVYPTPRLVDGLELAARLLHEPH